MKYFIISDIHGHYKEMRSALRKAGYRKTDEDSVLVVLGDIFDRGSECVKVYRFLRSIPKNRRVLIRGNHEFFLKAITERGYLLSADINNGTANTIEQFVKNFYPGLKFNSLVQPFINTGVVQWIFSDEWVNYWECDNLLFVHSWIPYEGFYCRENWRDASFYAWMSATLACPWKMIQVCTVPEDKIIVCGHWKTSDFRTALDGAPADNNDNSTYIGEKIVGLDGCVYKSGFCNVLVLEK